MPTQTSDGTRTCSLCGKEYLYPFEGGRKYHHECAKEAKRHQDRLYYRLKTSVSRSRAHEYEWEWACSTCGMKHQGRRAAVSCCNGTWDKLNPDPIHMKGGGFWVYAMEPTMWAR
jgi:hypothetical protein